MWESVELRHLRAFLAVAEELHFGRAAERLRLTQSRVSQLVQALETIVAAPLFERTSRRVALTPTGAQLLDQVRPLYDGLRQAIADLNAASAGIAGELRLGIVVPTSGGPRLPQVIGLFESRHPACSVIVTDVGFADPLEPLRRGEVDMLAIRFPIRQRDLVVGPVLTTDRRALAVAVGHPLASRPSVSVEDLGDYVVAQASGLPRELLEAFTPQVTPSGRPIAHREIRGAVDNLSQVARGEIVHVTIESVRDYLPYPGVTYVPIEDLPPSKAGLLWRSSGESPAIRAFAKAAEDVLTRPHDASQPPAAAQTP
jgi:DNA-binding transcriptional LysR family regulator